MLKKLLTAAAAVFLLFAAPAVVSEDFDLLGTDIDVAAETSGDYEYYYGYVKALASDFYFITLYNGYETKVTLPSTLDGNRIRVIADGAFWNNKRITSVTIPYGYYNICDRAFWCCSNLSDVKFPESLIIIEVGAFMECESLRKVTLPNGLKIIGDGAFNGCENLSSINIPNSVTTIEEWAFCDCKSLTNVTLPNKITKIEPYTFFKCTGLKSVTIPNSVTSIAAKAFAECEGLTNVTIPNSVTSIGEDAFYKCKSLTNITLPNKITSIEADTFQFCAGLKSVTIPNSVKIIGDCAFEGCTSLTSVTIPNSVTKIGGYAFYDCSKLKIVSIPPSVKEIESEAFDKCSSSLTIYGKTGSYAEEYAKENGFNFVPYKSISSYKASIPYAYYTYRGRAIKPSVTVKNTNGTKLTKGTDYTVSYSNNTKVGTATITVTGIGKYTGTLKKTFKVSALDLASSYAKVEIPYSSYTYTGSAIKPEVTVKFKDGDKIPASDYSVSYSANTKVGVATITVKGKTSNVTGTVKKTFIIKPAKNEITSISTTKGAFKINWKKGTAGTVGYQILYSQNKAALEAAVGEVKNSNAKKYVHSYTSTKLDDLNESFSSYPNSGETWYVKVRSFYTKDGKTTSTRYGNYSAVKSIKVK